MYTPPSSSVWNTFFSVGTSLKPSLPPRSTHMKLPLASARSIHVRMQWVPMVGDHQHAASEPTHAFEAATVTPRSANHCRVYDCASASRARFVWMKLRRKALSLSSAENMTSAGEDTAVSNGHLDKASDAAHASSALTSWPSLGGAAGCAAI